MLQFPLDRRLGAIVASKARIKRRNADIESREAVSESLRQDVCRVQIRSWYEATHLTLCARATLLNPREKLLNHTVVAAGALSGSAACRVRSQAVKQTLTEASAWEGSVGPAQPSLTRTASTNPSLLKTSP